MAYKLILHLKDGKKLISPYIIPDKGFDYNSNKVLNVVTKVGIGIVKNCDDVKRYEIYRD